MVGVLSAIVGPSKKLTKPINAAHELWVGLHASVGRVRYLCNARTELVLESGRSGQACPLWAKSSSFEHISHPMSL